MFWLYVVLVLVSFILGMIFKNKVISLWNLLISKLNIKGE